MGSDDWKKELVRVAPYYANRLAEPLADDVDDTLAELRDVGIDLPEDLVLRGHPKPAKGGHTKTGQW